MKLAKRRMPRGRPHRAGTGVKGLVPLLQDKVCIMGVLNVTPDSFSDGGKYFDTKKALCHGVKMAGDGADIIDVGGESTRPGAKNVDPEEEIVRIVPVIKELSRRIRVPISVDTRKARVAEEAVKAGARIINDVSGLTFDHDMASVAARYKVPVIVMHMKGTPEDMQKKAVYKNLVAEIITGLKRSIAIARHAGVKEERIIIDPGIGFAKTAEHNLTILNRLDDFKVLKRPICVGISRKSFIGKVLGIEDPRLRSVGTIAATMAALMKGANIIRVHDVAEAVQLSKIFTSITMERVIRCK